MTRYLTIIFVLTWGVASAQEATVIKIDRLHELMTKKEDKILVLNFWATWCAPCVAELPFFESLHAAARPDVEVALVSLDLDLDPNPEKVYKFVRKKNIKSDVYLLDEADPNSWIDTIEKEWSGALPATIVLNKLTGKRIFVGKPIHDGDLEKMITEVKN